MPKVRDVYHKACEIGMPKGIYSHEVLTLLSSALDLTYSGDVMLHLDDEISAESPFFSQFQRVLDGEPVEYVLHKAKFLQHSLYVDERVLIPRNETEELVANISELIYDYFDPRNFLVVADIGTGSGCIAIALKTIAKNWLITASDDSDGALEVAKKNISESGLSINVLKGRSLKPYIENNMNLDIIVSNPPYIRNKEEVQESVRLYEPESALYLDENNSVYEEIFRDYKQVKHGALLMCFEIGYDLKDYLVSLMEKYLEDYEYKFIEDLNGLTRFLFIYLQ